jgi:hypothetical protein
MMPAILFRFAHPLCSTAGNAVAGLFRRSGCLLFILLCIGAGAARADSISILRDDFAPDGENEFGVTSVQLWSADGKPRSGEVQAKFGDCIRLCVENLPAWLDYLKTDKTVTTADPGVQLVADEMPVIRLVVGQHLMKTIPAIEFYKDEPTWFWDNDWEKTLDAKKPDVAAWIKEHKAAADEASKRWWLFFVLKRDSADAASRQDWQDALTMAGRAPKLRLTIGLTNPTTQAIHVMPSSRSVDGEKDPNYFQMVTIGWDPWSMFGVIILGGALLSFAFMAFRTGIVRDPTQPIREDGLPPFSLGRCQMAFWFFLTAGAFYFLWLVTGRGDVDTINSTALTLIGISAGTALGAAIISQNQADPNAVAALPPVNYRAEIAAARAAAAAAKAVNAPDLPARTRTVIELKQRLAAWRHANWSRFITDILSESDGPGSPRMITFHRFQIVVWSLVMGIVFISAVLTKHAMPEFNSTLLTLMGVSSGTYLGFKLPVAKPTG